MPRLLWLQCLGFGSDSTNKGGTYLNRGVAEEASTAGSPSQPRQHQATLSTPKKQASNLVSTNPSRRGASTVAASGLLLELHAASSLGSTLSAAGAPSAIACPRGHSSTLSTTRPLEQTINSHSSAAEGSRFRITGITEGSISSCISSCSALLKLPLESPCASAALSRALDASSSGLPRQARGGSSFSDSCGLSGRKGNCLRRATQLQEAEEVLACMQANNIARGICVGAGPELAETLCQKSGESWHDDEAASGHGGDQTAALPLLSASTLNLVHLATAGKPLHVSSQLPEEFGGAWEINRFDVIRKLYTGYCAKVYRAKCRNSGVNVALKVYNLRAMCDFLRHQAFREVDLHRRLVHSNIVHLYAAFVEDSYLVLVQEYARGGNLYRVMRKLGGRLTEPIAVQVVLHPFLQALKYLHSQEIVHRDIKPENILFTEDWQLKLIDFGVAIDLNAERAVTRTGTETYMAPEVARCPLKRGPEDNKSDRSLAYTPAADTWSVGVMAYELLQGFPPDLPERCQSALAITLAVNSSSPAADSAPLDLGSVLPFPRPLTSAARAFILLALRPHPMDRPTTHDMLSHPWVEGLAAAQPLVAVGGAGGGAVGGGGVGSSGSQCHVGLQVGPQAPLAQTPTQSHPAAQAQAVQAAHCQPQAQPQASSSHMQAPPSTMAASAPLLLLRGEARALPLPMVTAMSAPMLASAPAPNYHHHRASSAADADAGMCAGAGLHSDPVPHSKTPS